MRRAIVTLLAGWVGWAPSPLWAQDDNQRKAAAETLFDEGRKLLFDGDNAAACRRFEQSLALDPGVGTLLYLGECYDRIGRTASAWARYREAYSAARAANQDQRARLARERADKDEPLLARLTVQVADANPREGFELTINGAALDNALLGVAFPIDPGRYEIVARAFGRAPWSSVIEIEPTRQHTLQIPVLQPTNDAAPLPAVDPYAASPRAGAPRADAGGPLSPMKRASIIVAAGGVAALATGVVFGLVASGKDDDATEVCGDVCLDPGRAEALNDQAQHWAVGANIAYVVGGLALATSGALFFWPEKTPPAASSVRRPALGLSARLGPNGGLLTIGGAL